VECPQYSIRLEARPLDLYTAELSFNVFFKLNTLHVSTSLPSEMTVMSRDSIVDRHCLPVRQPASDVAENFGRFLVVSIQARGMTLN